MKIVVIGAGPAGRNAAMEAAESGNEVTLIEYKHVGGKCLNHACMVNCALNDIARHKLDSENLYDFGIVDQKATIDYPKVCQGIKDTQKVIRANEEKEAVEVGVEFVHGKAEIDATKKVAIVEDDEYPYDKLLICTGAEPFIPNTPGAEKAYTYKDILNFEELPEKVVIIGGGSTAAEYAGIYSAFGSEVNVLCRSRFLKMLQDPEDEEYVVSHLLKNATVHESVDIKEITDTSVITGNGEIEGTVILATGVTPTSDIVEGIVEIGDRGNIIVDEYMQTSNPDIYAAGDVIGGVLSTPVARMEACTAIKNMMGAKVKPDYLIMPLTISLEYDVSYLKGDKVSSNGRKAALPGSAGPGSFWYTKSGRTGITKEVVNEEGEITNLLAITPASNIALPYMVKMIKDGNKVDDLGNFMEIHPTPDGVYKITKHFKRFEDD